MRLVNCTGDCYFIHILYVSLNLVFYTHCTGKLMYSFTGSLPPQHTFATASTGVAACHIGGTTLHAFAGMSDASLVCYL